jgi:3-hydroxyisobutyrate dehydrogenase-like beta-hydroxyacid dehydrogenase
MSTLPDRIAFIGFGEAASAFVEGWGTARPRRLTAYDIKTDSHDPGVRLAKRNDYILRNVDGATTLTAALDGATVVFSLVTADQAMPAAESAAAAIGAGTLYLDCNSCSPAAKRAAAAAIDAAGGRYVDIAVMAPVRPALHRVPLLAAGPHAGAAAAVLESLGMHAEVVAGGVGGAAAVKLTRSIMIKGLEALTLECLLAGRQAGVDEAVLDSLEASFPGFGWRQRAGYMLERMMVHGRRRAAEMRESAANLEELGLPGDMARASVAWQQRVGDLGLDAAGGDYRTLADRVLGALADPAAKPATN